MVGLVGFEPTHHDTKNRCLTAWLQAIKNGDPYGTRTRECMDENHVC